MKFNAEKCEVWEEQHGEAVESKWYHIEGGARAEGPGVLIHKSLKVAGIQHVTLRNNNIDDVGAKLIGEALSTIKKHNKNLLSLSLAFNHITDQGAGYIADGLRLNRTLLWLSLAYNQIGDKGAVKLAEVLGPFALTHEEIVARRHLLLESQERQRSPLFTRRPDSKSDRSNSQLGSSTNIEKLEKSQRSGRTTSKKKEKKEVAGQDKPTMSITQLAVKKDDFKIAKRGSLTSDMKASKTKVSRSGNKEKRNTMVEQEIVAFLPPLLEFGEHRDGKIYLLGNFCLLNINLTHNQITETGLKAFLKTIKDQIDSGHPSPDGRSTSGLLRLAITKNAFPVTCETFVKLQELMAPRDPIVKHRVVCTPMGSHSEQITPS
ncbi:leucine-rich repeat-containing protein 71-like [Heptranchias perlo]|uniref:leucine-rich repeat-containing protein 71-like n=1 Tax=Heptranchias perlo TaxID=212740 RepID=UPI003559DDAC